MSLDIRHAVFGNIKGNTTDQFQEIIEDAIANGEEKMLPGLGVLFEVIWQNTDNNSKNTMLETLSKASSK